MNCSAIYSDEEMTVVFTAKMERCDYGVERSPVWYEVNPDTIEIQSLEMLGADVDPDTLPKDLLDEILDLSGEVDFEVDE